MRILAVIPARGGSKRLPGKNVRLLGGKPLIAWSIEVARDIPEICDVLVSTDDPAIATASLEHGAYVPWLRPTGLATDTASSVDVALHALDWYQNERGVVDGVLLLQPTSPFRTKKTVLKGIELFEDNRCQPVVGITPTHAHPMWTLRIDGEYLVPFMREHGLELPAQELPPAYVVNGSFYLISPTDLRASQSFFGKRALPLLIESSQEALDIDTPWDWLLAESVLIISKRIDLCEK